MPVSLQEVRRRYNADLVRCEENLMAKRRRLVDELKQIDQEYAQLREEMGRFGGLAPPFAVPEEEKKKITLQQYQESRKAGISSRIVVIEK